MGQHFRYCDSGDTEKDYKQLHFALPIIRKSKATLRAMKKAAVNGSTIVQIGKSTSRASLTKDASGGSGRKQAASWKV